ncbi:MAG: competence/damage-inducible protein A [Spirochaetes bacterium]|nr:competence/damage-inducible protein A [Spirochaetota bacterium]
MFAEILATGDEIRTGALVDTNTAYISEKLEQAGIEVTRHTAVGDEIQIMTSVLLEISERCDFAVVTGGLGPTTDDISAEAAAKAAGVELILNESALEQINSMFQKFGRKMSPSNRKQAMFPEGSKIMSNPVGTAPGFSLKINNCRFFFVPGVPFEMCRMINDHVMPEIASIRGDIQHNLLRTISVFGLGESVVGEKSADVASEFKGIKLGLRAKFPETQIKLYMQGIDELKMQDTLDKAAQWIYKKIGDRIFSMNGLSMEQTIGNLLREKKATLAVAESCTGGLIANLLTDIDGSSDYFLYSGVTYSNDSKINILGVKPETIEQYGAVSEETVREMAEGTKRISGAHYGLATSGIAGPGGGTEDKPVGTVCIGLATPEATFTIKKKSVYARLDDSYGNRLRNKQWFAMLALEILRKNILGIKNNDL